MFHLGLDIGGTKMAAVVLDTSGREIHRYRTATRKASYPQFLDAVCQFIASIQRDAGAPLTVGIALPGAVSPLSGLIKNANILALNGQPVQGDLERRLGQRIVLANDANCFALSEARDGAGRGHDIVFGITLGTGCGGGLVINQRPIVGRYGNAAECGHITLPGYTPEQDGPAVTCYCGRQNCAEAFISGSGLGERYYQATGRRLCAEEIIARAEAQEPDALRQIDGFRDRLARTLATVVNLIDPGIIVLGGGLSNVAPLVDALGPLVARHVFTDRFVTPIAVARHGDSSGMRGAAWLGAGSEHALAASPLPS